MKHHAERNIDATASAVLTDYPEPLAYSIEQTCAVSSLKRSTVYALIRSRKLAVTHIGRRTLVLASSLRALIGEVS